MKYTVDDVLVMRTPILSARRYELLNDIEKCNVNITEIMSTLLELKEAVAVSSLDLISTIMDKKIDKKQ